MKNFLRKWLGINEDVQAIAADMNSLLDRCNNNALQTYELFHALPFSPLCLGINAKAAAQITAPNGIQANSLTAVLMGIILNARQGHSYLRLDGDLTDEIKHDLLKRGFKVEESEGTAGKAVNILWT